MLETVDARGYRLQLLQSTARLGFAQTGQRMPIRWLNQQNNTQTVNSLDLCECRFRNYAVEGATDCYTLSRQNTSGGRMITIGLGHYQCIAYS